MADKQQRNIRMEDQLVDRLKRLAPKAGFSSWNEFAAGALDLYAETLCDCIIELRKGQRETIERQRKQLLAEASQAQLSGIARRK